MSIEKIPLSKTANQSLSVYFDQVAYELIIKESRGAMSITIVRDNVTLVSSFPCLSMTPVIPYNYLSNGMGNFVWKTPNDDLPYWTNFDSNHELFYVPQDVIDAA